VGVGRGGRGRGVDEGGGREEKNKRGDKKENREDMETGGGRGKNGRMRGGDKGGEMAEGGG